jgi:ornithine cyclodeaminase/alanine dehydrogenase
MLVLTEAELAGLGITTRDAVASIEALIRAQAEGRAWSAPKSAIRTQDGRYMMTTLSAADDPPVMCVKSLIANPENPARGLEQLNSQITVLDSQTGVPAAVMGGNWITAIRTAALSAVAAKRLADPDARVAAFVGCGAQGHAHLTALADLFPLREVRAVGRGKANIQSLCRAAEARGLSARGDLAPEAALRDADIVVSAITLNPSIEPFLDPSWLKPGAFAAITDVLLPWRRDHLAAFDQIVIDDWQQDRALDEGLVPPDLVTTDLKGLVLEGAPTAAGPTAFIFRGLPLGDLAVAALAYERARAGSR